MKRIKIKNHIAIAFFITAFVMLFILCLIASTLYGDLYDVPMLTSRTFSVNDGWTLETAPGEAEPLTLPSELRYRGEEPLVLTCTLPEYTDVGKQLVVFVGTNHMDIRAYLDDEELYAHVTAGKGMSKTPGNVYHMMNLPQDYVGRQLRLELTPLLGGSIHYTVPAPLIAPRGAILNHIFQTDLLAIIMVSLIFSFGIALLFLAHSLRKIANVQRHLIYIGVFAVVFALYALCETEVLHLFVANSYVIYLCDLLSFALIPVPLLLLLKEYTGDTSRKCINIVLGLALTNFFAQALLNFFNIVDLRQMLKLTHLVDILAILLMIASVYMRRNHMSGAVRRFGISVLPIVIGGIIDLVMFYIPQIITENSFFFQVGVLMFVIIQMHYVIRMYFDLYMKNVKVDLYEKMAYTDALTDIANRAAFERTLTMLETQWQAYMPLWCITADINNLKTINDTKGHSAGDVAIRQTAQIFKQCVSQVYRTGGDEFVIFLYHTEAAEAQSTVARIQQLFADYNESHETKLSVAMGCDCLHGENDNILDLYIRTDKLMYADKKKTKGGQ